jgi:hypothetical protein
MRTKSLKNKLLRSTAIVTIGIVLGYLFFFVWFPLVMIGAPTSLYSIHNFGTKNHTLTIKILDSTNTTVLVKTYDVRPTMSITYDRGFGWYPTATWTPFTWSEGEYTFSAILDQVYTASYTTHVQITQTIAIHIDFMDTPLEITEVWV